MQDLMITLIGIVIGITATVLASRYYFRRSVEKKLVPFIQNQTNVLSNIEPGVKDNLSIEYEGVKVNNLQQIQFLIANTGERAIKDIIKPLKVEISNNAEVMDANILHIHPEGREVTLNIGKSGSTVDFNFPLLNKDEFFICKLLINGIPEENDFKFSIVADDLPPLLKIEDLDYNQIEKQEDNASSNKKELGFIFLLGSFFLLIAFFIGIPSHYLNDTTIPMVQNEQWTWLNSIPFASISVFINYLIAIFFAGTGAMLILTIPLGRIELFKRKKYLLPQELANPYYWRLSSDEDEKTSPKND